MPFIYLAYHIVVCQAFFYFSGQRMLKNISGSEWEEPPIFRVGLEGRERQKATFIIFILPQCGMSGGFLILSALRVGPSGSVKNL